jgi:hypothetical protein
MATFYKPYRYWWNYYSDLAYSKNGFVSRFFNVSGTVIFGLGYSVVWLSIGNFVDNHILLIQIAGIIGSLSLIGTIVFPYEKFQQVLHGFLVMLSVFGLNLALYVINLEYHSWLLRVNIVAFIVYFIVWAIANLAFRADLKKARPFHSPVQKLYVLILELALLSVLLGR